MDPGDRTLSWRDRISGSIHRLRRGLRSLSCARGSHFSAPADIQTVASAANIKLSAVEKVLFEAARQNRVDLITKIGQEAKCSMNVKDVNERTALHFAASLGNLDAVKELVKYKAVVDSTDKYGITPLLWSVYNNHKSIAVFLLNNNAKHNIKTTQGLTISHFVAESNALGILKYLYQRFQVLHIDEVDNNGKTPFLVAASRGNHVLLEVFARKRANVEHTDKAGHNALHLASEKGHFAAVRYLTQLAPLRQHINDLDQEQKTPLCYAVQGNHASIVRQLLQSGADPDKASSKNEPPLLIATKQGAHQSCEVLLQHGAEKYIKSKYGDTAVHVAAAVPLPGTIGYLYSRGFDMNVRNRRGMTPLHVAIEENKIHSVEALLLCGARTDIVDEKGETPLQTAALSSYTGIADLIIKADRWRQNYPVQADEVQRAILESHEGWQQVNHHQQQPARNGRRVNWPQESYSSLPNSFNRRNLGSPISTTNNSWSGRRRDPFDGFGLDGDSPYDVDGYNEAYGPMSKEYQPRAATMNPAIRRHQPRGGLPPQPQRAPRTNPVQFSNPDINRALRNQQSATTLPHRSTSNNDFIDPFAANYQDDFQWPISSPSIQSDDLPLGYEAGQQWSRFNSRYVDRGGGRNVNETVLPSGEVLLKLNSDGVDNMDDQMMMGQDVSPQGFRLTSYSQPYAEQIKIYMFDLAHKRLKPEDWKKLAYYWQFRHEHVEAINYQNSTRNGYQECGYRVMSIWLHGVPPDQSAIDQLYTALVGIDRRKLANDLRSKVQAVSGGGQDISGGGSRLAPMGSSTSRRKISAGSRKRGNCQTQ